jgi:hypothetical protein
MKRTFILILVTLACLNISAQKSKVKLNPRGLWAFESPTAPEGYTTGIIEITLAKKKYSVTMSFTGNDYKRPAEDIKFEKDSLQFYLNVDGTDVTFKSKFDQTDKMSGVALTNGGSVPFVLTREKNKIKSQNGL